MEKIDTSVGPIFVRNDWDKEVIKEVIDNHEYERWGDITIKKNNTVIDCGAHIGVFSRLALTAGAKVIAIEPDEENFSLLLENTAEFSNIKFIKAVLWDGKDVKFLKDKKRGELNKVSERGELTSSVSLDTIIKKFNIKQIDLLKMDIEGSEYKVLKEFKNFKMVKQITMEWHYGAKKLAYLILFLENRGFKTVWLGGNGDWGKLQMKKI